MKPYAAAVAELLRICETLEVPLTVLARNIEHNYRALLEKL